MNAQDKALLRGVGERIGPLPVVDEEPTPLIHEIPAGDPFPLDAMGPFKAAAVAIQDMTQAPAAIGAQSPPSSGVTGLSGACGCTDPWRHSANLTVCPDNRQVRRAEVCLRYSCHGTSPLF